MKIYVTGEVIHIERKSEIDRVELARVVGLIDLGANNGDNNFGWSGLKAVVNFNNLLFILDFPEDSIVTTDDGLLINAGHGAWWPSMESLDKYDLYLFNKDHI